MEETNTAEFDEYDLDTGRRLIVVVYDEASDEVEVENPHELPVHEVIGLLRVALRQAEDPWEYDDEEDDEPC